MGRWVPTSYFLLLTSYFLRPTSYVLRPTSYFLLPTGEITVRVGTYRRTCHMPTSGEIRRGATYLPTLPTDLPTDRPTYLPTHSPTRPVSFDVTSGSGVRAHAHIYMHIHIPTRPVSFDEMRARAAAQRGSDRAAAGVIAPKAALCVLLSGRKSDVGCRM